MKARALGAAIPDPDESKAPAEAAATFAEIRAFYARADVPVAFRLLATDPGYLADVWGAARRAFVDHRLSRRPRRARDDARAAPFGYLPRGGGLVSQHDAVGMQLED